jgi:diketogulonate reductase-like aldo/keto reductase
MLEDLYKNNYIRNIGVSNYRENELEFFNKNIVIKPFTNQIEVNPFCTRVKLIDYCRKNNIPITAHSPLAKGEKFNDNVLINIANKYNVSPAQLMIRWSLQNNLIVIPRSQSKTHIKENIVHNFIIKDEDMILLNNLNCNYATHPKYL